MYACASTPVSCRPVAFATDRLPDTLARKLWFREGLPRYVTLISESPRIVPGGFPRTSGFARLQSGFTRSGPVAIRPSDVRCAGARLRVLPALGEQRDEDG